MIIVGNSTKLEMVGILKLQIEFTNQQNFTGIEVIFVRKYIQLVDYGVAVFFRIQ